MPRPDEFPESDRAAATATLSRLPRTSGTARQLVRMRGWLLATTMLLIATSFAVWDGVQTTATTVRDRIAPAVLAATSAKVALIRADKAAVHSFDSGEALLAGPGDDYQNQAALASQDLARAAELNEAGARASDDLQVIEALLSEYTAAIEQADAHFRQPDGHLLAVADLWNAWQLLHSDPDGVLVHLNDLLGTQRAELALRLSDDWTYPLVPPLSLVPGVLLLALLIWTQWTVKRRFRRRFNPPLLAATVLLATVVAAMSWTFVVQRNLGHAQDLLEQVVAERDAQAHADGAAEQQELATMLARYCSPSAGCEPTVASAVPRAAEVAPSDQTGDISTVNETLNAAASAGWLQYAAPLASVVIGVLTLWGLQPRIDEYRYRP